MTGKPVAIALSLPLPPSVNNQYLTAGRKRVLSPGALRFRNEVAKRIERERLDGRIPFETERVLRESLIGVYLTFFFASPMRRDLDGGLKIALDAVCEALGIDDRTVVDLHLTKQIDPLRPRLELELEAIAEWSFDRNYVYLGDPEPPRTMEGDAIAPAPTTATEEPTA